MFSLFFVASLVLPSVLGNCCFPDIYSAIIYDPAAGTSDLLVDWTADKYAIVPRGGDLKSVLFHIDAKLKYLRYADGSCETKADPEPYTQCLPKSLTPIGYNTLGGSLGINTFDRKVGTDQDYITLTDDCLPVISVSIAKGGAVDTKIFGNVTVTSTTFSELSADVSDCKMAEV